MTVRGVLEFIPVLTLILYIIWIRSCHHQNRSIESTKYAQNAFGI